LTIGEKLVREKKFFQGRKEKKSKRCEIDCNETTQDQTGESDGAGLVNRNATTQRGKIEKEL